jgi:tetratricopeptide (TPR) repeat protein
MDYMLGFAWLTFRQADEALKNGRLEEAHRFLCQPAAHGHKKSWQRWQRLARAFVERGERRLRQDDLETAWADLLQAEQMAAPDCGAERLRQVLERQGLVDVRALLEAGEPDKAAEAVAVLTAQAVRHPDLKWLNDAARGWLQARDLAGRGEFNQALGLADRARKLLPGNVALAAYRAELENYGEAVPGLLVELHAAAEEARWRDVLRLADEVLRAAPEQKEARQARALAWKVLEPRPTVAGVPAEVVPVAVPESAQRFIIWVDGVGGFLVCLGARVTLGQATLSTTVDVPLLADVSRLHATLTRDAEGYLLEAVRSVQVNGRPADRALLRPDDRITLGAACQLRFRQPSPLSTTARLDLVTGHRLPQAVDGVILMSDSLVLGAGPQAHVTVPDLKQPVVLFRQRDGLGVRHAGDFAVNGEHCRDRAVLGPRASVSGEDFSLALEPALGCTRPLGERGRW